MPVTPANVSAAAAAIQRRIDEVDAKLRARQEAVNARKKTKERAVDTRRCILAGRAVIDRAMKNPRTAKGLADILDAFLKRDADRKVMAPLLVELRKLAGPPPVVPLRPKYLGAVRAPR